MHVIFETTNMFKQKFQTMFSAQWVRQHVFQNVQLACFFLYAVAINENSFHFESYLKWSTGFTTIDEWTNDYPKKKKKINEKHKEIKVHVVGQHCWIKIK